jgi:hypothetical protein
MQSLSLSSPITSPRRRRSLDEAYELAAAWRASGKNQAAWCRSQGIAKWTLKSCLARVKVPESDLSRPRSVGAVSGFIAVHPPAMVAVGEVRIDVGGGAQILGLDLAGVVAVLRGLREGSR